jgi:hypothetical protein
MVLATADSADSRQIRRRVRMTVLLNPGSPRRVAVPLVGISTRSELIELARAVGVPTILRITSSRRPRLPNAWR